MKYILFNHTENDKFTFNNLEDLHYHLEHAENLSDEQIDILKKELWFERSWISLSLQVK